MFFPEARVRVFVYGRPLDMRLRFTGLYALTKHRPGQDPTSGRLFGLHQPRGFLPEGVVLGPHRLLSVGEAAGARTLCFRPASRVLSGARLDGTDNAPRRTLSKRKTLNTGGENKALHSLPVVSRPETTILQRTKRKSFQAT